MYLITYDLGTGGVKAALYDEKLHVLGKTFIEYKTFFPRPDYHEQRPEDWWKDTSSAGTDGCTAPGCERDCAVRPEPYGYSAGREWKGAFG